MSEGLGEERTPHAGRLRKGGWEATRTKPMGKGSLWICPTLLSFPEGSRVPKDKATEAEVIVGLGTDAGKDEGLHHPWDQPPGEADSGGTGPGWGSGLPGWRANAGAGSGPWWEGAARSLGKPGAQSAVVRNRSPGPSFCIWVPDLLLSSSSILNWNTNSLSLRFLTIECGQWNYLPLRNVLSRKWAGTDEVLAHS